MTAIRKFAFAALLAVTALNFAPSLASAQEPARGKFTLTHDVAWGIANIPAGDYAFSFDPAGISPVLTLNKLSGTRESFLLLVPATDSSKPTDPTELVLKTTAAGSYVSAMYLPDSGLTLHFAAPAHPAGKEMAKTVTTASIGQ